MPPDTIFLQIKIYYTYTLDFRDISICKKVQLDISNIFPVFFYLGQNIQILEITQVPYYFVLICLKKIPYRYRYLLGQPKASKGITTV